MLTTVHGGIGNSQEMRIPLRRMAFVAWVFALLLFAGECLAQSSTIDNLGTEYRSLIGTWTSSLLNIATDLFWKLAIIELTWSGAIWAFQQDHLTSFTAVVVKKLMVIGFAFFLLQRTDLWLDPLLTGLGQAGVKAGSSSPVSPPFVFDVGIDTANALMSSATKLHLWENRGTAMLTILAALGILAGFTVFAAQMMIGLVESYIVIGTGVLFLGFGSTRWTVAFTQRFITYAFGVGVKLFLIYLITGVAMSQIQEWPGMLRDLDEFNTTAIFSVLGGSLFVAFLVYQVPNTAARVFATAPLNWHVADDQRAASSGTGAPTPSSPGSPALESARAGLLALGDDHSHSRSEGGNMLASALRAIGNPGVDSGNSNAAGKGKSGGASLASNVVPGLHGSTSGEPQSEPQATRAPDASGAGSGGQDERAASSHESNKSSKQPTADAYSSSAGHDEGSSSSNAEGSAHRSTGAGSPQLGQGEPAQGAGSGDVSAPPAAIYSQAPGRGELPGREGDVGGAGSASSAPATGGAAMMPTESPMYAHYVRPPRISGDAANARPGAGAVPPGRSGSVPAAGTGNVSPPQTKPGEQAPASPINPLHRPPHRPS